MLSNLITAAGLVMLTTAVGELAGQWWGIGLGGLVLLVVGFNLAQES